MHLIQPNQMDEIKLRTKTERGTRGEIARDTSKRPESNHDHDILLRIGQIQHHIYHRRAHIVQA
jgi:hypothetical protein